MQNLWNKTRVEEVCDSILESMYNFDLFSKLPTNRWFNADALISTYEIPSHLEAFFVRTLTAKIMDKLKEDGGSETYTSIDKI